MARLEIPYTCIAKINKGAKGLAVRTKKNKLKGKYARKQNKTKQNKTKRTKNVLQGKSGLAAGFKPPL